MIIVRITQLKLFMTNLLETPVGTKVRIKSIGSNRLLNRRLSSLGLKTGSEIEVMLHRNSGIVVANAGNRLALSKSIAGELVVEKME